VLQWLEAQHQAADGAAPRESFAAPRGSTNGHRDRTANHWQMTLFGIEEHPLLEEIRAADLDGMEPDDALALIHDWQRRLTSELAPANR
jgi:hypothetical protein